MLNALGLMLALLVNDADMPYKALKQDTNNIITLECRLNDCKRTIWRKINP